MLEVLFASRGIRTPRPVAGAIISTVVHATVVLAMLVSAHRSARELLEFRKHLEEAKLKPQFIIPPNRGAPPASAAIHYMAVGGGEAREGVANSRKKFDKRGDFGVAQIRGAQAPPESPTVNVPESTLPDNAYSVLDVDSAAVRDPSSAAPAYPAVMMLKSIEGYATMRFVIDSTGLIDLTTVALLDGSHAEFVQAVRDAMPRMRFHPAKMGLQAVRQLAEQLFKFEIKKVASSGESGTASKKP